MHQVHTLPNTRLIGKKGRQIFRELSPEFVENHRGEFMAIDVDSGEWFLGKTGLEATKKARDKYPGKVFFLGRIGHQATYIRKGHQ